MRRRQVIALVVAVLAAKPSRIVAQAAGKTWRIGFIAHRYEKFYEPLFSGLKELGYVEGQNLLVERRYAEGNAERFQKLADELVKLNVDAIIVVTTAIELTFSPFFLLRADVVIE
jgi:putative tryptophan/tyrosine transport system substrate-binding protein